MNYIINNNYTSLVRFSNNQSKTFNKPVHLLIKDICQNNLFDLLGYRRALNKVLKINRRPPIYINDNLILFPLKRIDEFDNTWINYANISLVERDKNNKFINIYFKNNDVLKVNVTFNYYLTKKEQINMIFHYLNSLTNVNVLNNNKNT